MTISVGVAGKRCHDSDDRFSEIARMSPKHVDSTRLVPIEDLQGDSEQDTALLRRMADDARAFLTEQTWCLGVERMWFGLGVGGIVAVFLASISTTSSDVDDTLWIVVGDLPSAYLVTDESPDAVEALKTYIAEMRLWIEAARTGVGFDEVIPVPVEPTREAADSLEKRLAFLEREVLGARGASSSS